MRADRLLQLLMLLQVRGRMTAERLAGELEVSERTIYRDIEALSMAGVPVYTERGPGGGCALMDRYRTSLTGLNEDEVRALFMLAIPEPLAQLGVERELKTALLKLNAALPAIYQDDSARIRHRIHLDSVWWSHAETVTPHLKVIYQAVWQDHPLRLVYRMPFDTLVERVVQPYGLVAKTNVWYLVCFRDGFMRVLRVSDIVEIDVLESTFDRKDAFDLVSFWQAWCKKLEQNRPYFLVRVCAAPEVFAGHSGCTVVKSEGTDAQGWHYLTLSFESFESARAQILGWGRAVEVLEPGSLRLSVVDFAQQVVEFYQNRNWDFPNEACIKGM